MGFIISLFLISAPQPAEYLSIQANCVVSMNNANGMVFGPMAALGLREPKQVYPVLFQKPVVKKISKVSRKIRYWFPAKHHRYVFVGAGGSSIAALLEAQGHEVIHLPFSGIEQWEVQSVSEKVWQRVSKHLSKFLPPDEDLKKLVFIDAGFTGNSLAAFRRLMERYAKENEMETSRSYVALHYANYFRFRLLLRGVRLIQIGSELSWRVYRRDDDFYRAYPRYEVGEPDVDLARQENYDLLVKYFREMLER